MYSDSCLCAFSFLRDPPFCKIDLLGGPAFCGFDVEGVPCISVALDPCSFCCGEVSLYTIECIFLWRTPLRLLHHLLVGFPGFVNFLGTMVSASVLGGTSWVRTGSLQSSCQSRMAISISSSLMQYLGCSHSLCGSLCSLIHMVCLIAQKLTISLYYMTTSRVIHQVLVMLSCISVKYLDKVPVFVLLCLGSDFISNDMYHVMQHRPIHSQKYEYGDSLHPINVISMSSHK
jgi:hypothetical protein